jgi:hypoxanthine phosphoribosyltransferase
MIAQRDQLRLPEGARRVFDRAEIDDAIDRLAGEITDRFSESLPLALCVMTGGLIFAGHLLTRLHFPLEVDYVHVTRYHGGRNGSKLQWTRTPERSVAERRVLLIDDVFDEGVTLNALADACRWNGAFSVHTVVLVNKVRPGVTRERNADFKGLDAPDRFLIGWGMDFQQRYRNLDEIYALRD